MIRMDAALEAERLQSRMLLQVHHELVFEMPDKIERAFPVNKHVMIRSPWSVVAAARRRSGAASNWDEAH